ncbi:hypothetical protein [Ruminococcus albus]|uniref:Uncharacterized protein n=1 Tax=Ruminococcus albus TaxID=1264 RepID=A0A1I1K6G9_RUMAL|nr:hypothetical protein [Ruminococcus albus]SFC56434.1 hypothetical protein SAMN02910406_01946 [Ruminococcus albus]
MSTLFLCAENIVAPSSDSDSESDDSPRGTMGENSPTIANSKLSTILAKSDFKGDSIVGE